LALNPQRCETGPPRRGVGVGASCTKSRCLAGGPKPFPTPPPGRVEVGTQALPRRSRGRAGSWEKPMPHRRKAGTRPAAVRGERATPPEPCIVRQVRCHGRDPFKPTLPKHKPWFSLTPCSLPGEGGCPRRGLTPPAGRRMGPRRPRAVVAEADLVEPRREEVEVLRPWGGHPADRGPRARGRRQGWGEGCEE